MARSHGVPVTRSVLSCFVNSQISAGSALTERLLVSSQDSEMMMPPEMQEMATCSIETHPVFTRGELATAMGLSKGSTAADRFLWAPLAAGRVAGLRRGLLAAGRNSDLTGPLAMPD